MDKLKNYSRICVIFIGLAILLLPHSIWACDRCFGANVDTPTTRGIGFAMLALLGITGGVSGGIVLFFLNMKKRIRILSRIPLEEWKLNMMDSESEVLNQLLDKINQSGYKSLSPQQRELLKEISR